MLKDTTSVRFGFPLNRVHLKNQIFLGRYFEFLNSCVHDSGCGLKQYFQNDSSSYDILSDSFNLGGAYYPFD
jgi:hypothetical protein